MRIAIDIGAGSVKMLSARFDGTRIVSLGSHEFLNRPLRLGSSLRIDIPMILLGIRQGIAALEAAHGTCESIGIDTYGNGYGILDSMGKLMGLPYHYRDRRTQGILESMSQRIALEDLYTKTGIFPVASRVLMQLFGEALVPTQAILEGATFLPFSDLLVHLLTGRKSAERTIASVSSLLDPWSRGWNFGLFGLLGIPERLFPGLSDGGVVAGRIGGEGTPGQSGRPIEVLEVVAHDTESALLASPFPLGKAVFASMGTSIIVGIQTKAPVINHTGYRLRLKNVAGAFGKNSLCKDFPGFWVISRCMDSWRQAGNPVGYEDLDALAARGQSLTSFLDLADPVFRSDEADMIQTIHAYCQRTGQAVPESREDLLRCILESMALQVAWSLEGLEEVSGDSDRSSIVAMNGGSRSSLLLQMTADATGLEVIAASPVASSLGNILGQLFASGELENFTQIQDVARASVGVRSFSPNTTDVWAEAMARAKRIGVLGT